MSVQVYDAPKHWTSTFTRQAYVSPDYPKSILLCYCGDATTAASFPHGNTRASNGRNYVRTQPHVLRDIQQAAGPARTVYQNLVLSGPSSVQQQTTAAPRNMEQVRNVQKIQRNKGRLTRDALYNLHEFAADSAFIHKIVTHPDLSVIMYSMDVIDLNACCLFLGASCARIEHCSANVNSRSRSLYAVARSTVCLSVVCLSFVTFVRPTQAVQIFGNISVLL